MLNSPFYFTHLEESVELAPAAGLVQHMHLQPDRV